MNQPPVKLSLRYRIGTWLRTKYGQRETNATNSTLTSSPDENLSTSKGEEPHQNGENATAIAADSIASSLPLREPPVDSFRGEGGTSLGDNDKLSIPARIWRSLNIILFSSYINLLLVFVPAGIALGALHRSQGPSSPISPTVIFAINAVAIIPLAYLLGFATESVARKMGDKVGALLNVTFGNAVELIIL